MVIAVGIGLVLAAGALVVGYASVARVAYFLISALVFLITWDGIRFAGGAFTDGLLLLAALAAGLQVAIDRTPIRLPSWLVASALILFMAAVLTAVSPPSAALTNQSNLEFVQEFAVGGIPITSVIAPRSNLSALAVWEIGLLVLPAVIAVVVRTPAQIRRLLDLWTAGATINALVGVLDLIGFHALAAKPILGHRSSGLTVHPNYLALTCLLAIPTACRLIGDSRRRNALGCLSLLILCGGEYASGSRDGAVTAVVILLMCVVALPKMRGSVRYVVPLLALLIAVALAVPSVGHAILVQTRLTPSGNVDVSINGSDYQRAVFARVAERQFAARPLSGVGMAVDEDAQNIYLQILAAGGLVAMAAMVIFVGGLFSSVRRALGTVVAADAAVAAIAMSGWLINGYFDAQLADKYVYVLPGILIACASVARTERARTASDPIGPGVGLEQDGVDRVAGTEGSAAGDQSGFDNRRLAGDAALVE